MPNCNCVLRREAQRDVVRVAVLVAAAERIRRDDDLDRARPGRERHTLRDRHQLRRATAEPGVTGPTRRVPSFEPVELKKVAVTDMLSRWSL